MLNKFRVKIYIRFLLSFAFTFGGLYVLTQTYYWLVSLWLFLFAGLTIYSLIKILEGQKRELSSFLMSISQNDFSNTYVKKAASNEDFELHMAYSSITDTMKELREEKESNYHFLQAIVEHSNIAMIGYTESDQQVTLMNEAAKNLFNKPFIKNLITLKSIDKELYNKIIKLESGHKILAKLLIKNELLNLSVSAKEIKLTDGLFKLVSFQNINAELDEKELESWQKLIRVLTHEIKNSAIPISTLTEVVNQLITDEKGDLRDLSKLDEEDLEDLKIGINTVEKRSKGLVKFVNAYGELARVPTPKIQNINLKPLVDDILALLESDMRNHTITVENRTDDHYVNVDPELLEQVLINLLKNAKEAFSDHPDPRIIIKSELLNGSSQLSIVDNGIGIEPSVIENIFVPFYTTKKEGSGIGLSLSRQIMRAHKGNLTVQSQPGQGTKFTLHF